MKKRNPNGTEERLSVSAANTAGKELQRLEQSGLSAHAATAPLDDLHIPPTDQTTATRIALAQFSSAIHAEAIVGDSSPKVSIASIAEIGPKDPNELRVLCSPRIPENPSETLRGFYDVAQSLGQTLILVSHTVQRLNRAFGQSFIVFEELSELMRPHRHVVKWRGKKMVWVEDKWHL